MNKNSVSNWLKSLQNEICEAFKKLDTKASFNESLWERTGGGGGITRIIQNGGIIEKGGVNFSEVYGTLSAEAIKSLSLLNYSVSQAEFYATGISIVIHPYNPFVPIIHMNLRYLELFPDSEKEKNKISWFGGGIDLTPAYINLEDAKFFHQSLKNICEKHNSSYYADFKKFADEYFFIPHRNETRGIGGIFFDRLTAAKNISLLNRFNFVQDLGKLFIPTYSQLITKNYKMPFEEKNKEFQLFRRGRYAEFNLIYDRGTKFGLETGGRAESILMSLPPTVKWHYDFIPNAGSNEEKTLNLLKKNIDWINF